MRVEIVQYVLLVGLVSVKIFVPVELPVCVDFVLSVVVLLLVSAI